MEVIPIIHVVNGANFPNVEGFNNVLRPLLDSLRNHAASGNSTYKFALQSVECTSDLSKLNCSSYLQQLQILKKGLFYFIQKEEKQEEANTKKKQNKETKPALFTML